MTGAWSRAAACAVIALGAAPARQDLELRAREGAELTKHARTLGRVRGWGWTFAVPSTERVWTRVHDLDRR